MQNIFDKNKILIKFFNLQGSTRLSECNYTRKSTDYANIGLTAEIFQPRKYETATFFDDAGTTLQNNFLRDSQIFVSNRPNIQKYSIEVTSLDENDSPFDDSDADKNYFPSESSESSSEKKENTPKKRKVFKKRNKNLLESTSTKELPI
uniref:Uncharacterized protein LOC114345959 n=1 Tax=Diabrotica virgifera virgifera TaxID=50390 RepID=A0A6P7H9H8_DIAVI